jgi:uncharacterized protein
MARPQCCRKIMSHPDVTCYHPRGVEPSSLETVTLTLDEYEAVRLADLEGFYHGDAAGMMNVSRQTFGRIIESARRKIADTLINGKALVIEGGHVAVDDPKGPHCPACSGAASDTGECRRPGCPHCPSHPKKTQEK